MSLTGVEIDVATLGIKLKPNTFLAVISDDSGQVKVVKVDHESIAKDKPFLQVAADGAAVARGGGCWKRINGDLKWFNPCV